MVSEKRNSERIFLPLYVNIEALVHDANSWKEDTFLKDLSALGAGFTLKRPVKLGQLLFFAIPMPPELRQYEPHSEKYHVWGIVTRCVRIKKNEVGPLYAVGAAFIGKDPPPHYYLHPGRLYELSNDAPEKNGFWKISSDDLKEDERGVPDGEKRPTRLHMPVALTIELVNEDNQVLTSETTVTENISLRGAAVFSELYVQVGSLVRVTSKLHRVTLMAIVRGRRVGADGINRLHLEFIDKLFPLDGVL